jgi:hypothetical protein
MGKDLFMPILTLIVDGHAGELFIDGQQSETFDGDSGIRWRALSQSVFVHMWACSGDFQVRPLGQGNSPREVLKTVRVVHHRDRTGEKGGAQTHKEYQQGNV